MIGPTEILVILGAFLLVGGGGGGAVVLSLRQAAAKRAREAVEAEVRRRVPRDVRDLARKLGRPIDGDGEASDVEPDATGDARR